MNYSDIALKTLVLKEKYDPSLSSFWKDYSSEKKITDVIPEDFTELEHSYRDLLERLENEHVDGFICVFDDVFPVIKQVDKKRDRPYLFFYKGNISLLEETDRNVAVVGLVDPTEEIAKREKRVVEQLVIEDNIIVSGLAKGCDTIAHRECLNLGGKTIAILPSQIGKIFPSENRALAEEIVENGGLLLTEYYKDATDRYAAISRFTDRDRLQAMLSKAVVMIASYRKGSGDSGSRYAMEVAERFGIERFVMFDKHTDINDPRFGLNSYYALPDHFEGIERKVNALVLTRRSISSITQLSRNAEEQDSLF